jgi:hypothetical protein
MTAPSSIDPARFLDEQLAQASPDLLRQLLTTFINMGHEVGRARTRAAQYRGIVLAQLGAELNRRRAPRRVLDHLGDEPGAWEGHLPDVIRLALQVERANTWRQAGDPRRARVLFGNAAGFAHDDRLTRPSRRPMRR